MICPARCDRAVESVLNGRPAASAELKKGIMAMTDPTKRLRVLLLASDCNPEWPSLPVVGYKYAKALAARCDVVVATHSRNRENLEKRQDDDLEIAFINTEYISRPMYNFAKFLRGGTQVAWSTNMMFAYPPYVEFERQVWKRFRKELEAGEFDVVHRITPMSPTMPSYIAGKLSRQPFVLGPLNGNLAWPKFFAAEQAREKEGLRKLRNLYKYLPFVRSTYRKAACILAAFQHTIDDLEFADPAKIVMFPEVGYDETLFHETGRKSAAADAAADVSDPDAGKTRFLFAGRLVPYKLPEVLVRAVAGSPVLRKHIMHFVGDGPEMPRLKAMVEEHGLQDCIRFEGRTTQEGVADWMRACDVFVFPSIRELGAGVVVEAMACGMLNIVVNYGAPGSLISPERGMRVELAPLDGMVDGFRDAMERAVAIEGPEREAMREAATRYAFDKLRWSAKAEFTEDLYRRTLDGAPATAPFPDFYGSGAD
jgi:glycosyltransferase involved in cell wall biosynthesis